jgi:membrane-bound serine protease (ClpP class)
LDRTFGDSGRRAVVLSSYALVVTPTNWFGVALVLLALALFVTDLKATNHGAPAAGGVLALVLGVLVLFDLTAPYSQVLLVVLVMLAILTGAILTVVLVGAMTTGDRPATTGMEGMIGEEGVVKAPVGAKSPGWVFVRGEWWRAVVATAPEEAHEQQVIKIGRKVQVVGFREGKVVVLPFEPSTFERIPED